MATGESLPEEKRAEEPVPPAVEAVDLGPIGPKSRYEFTGDQERTIADLSGKMGFVGAFLLALTVIGLIRVIVAAIRGNFDAIGAINTLLFGCIAIWTITASGAFAEVVTTVGRDVTHLMDALESLRKMYSLLYWLLVAAILASAILLLQAAFFVGG